jgi:hypothetical protein
LASRSLLASKPWALRNNSSFQQDLNGDNVLESIGSTTLEQHGNNYFLHPSGGSPVELSFGGAPVEAGQFDHMAVPGRWLGRSKPQTGMW